MILLLNFLEQIHVDVAYTSKLLWDLLEGLQRPMTLGEQKVLQTGAATLPSNNYCVRTYAL